ncbi:MAG: polysaccharide deacetylase family protein [Nocardioides sp.]
MSFTFDGTFKGQEDAAEILSENGLAGTFYINSGYLDFPAYLSVDQLRSIARNRNEIGGASLFGNDLSRLPEEEATAQVCSDRATLAQLGFQVTSFAYPHGAGTAQVKAVAQACGYNSAREFAGLYESAEDCSSCPSGEPMPPVDDFRIRTPSPGTSLDTLQRHVLRAEDNGGGWVPLVFTNVCVCPEEGDDAISPTEFTTFVQWMTERPPSTTVKTVDQVMGGPLKPVKGEPVARLVPDPSVAIGSGSSPGALSKKPAWTVAGIGIGQSQIIFFGVLLTVAIILTYRVASRGNRYARR